MSALIKLPPSYKIRPGSIHDKDFDPDKYVSPWPEYFEDEWEKLDDREKQIMRTYKRHLSRNTDPWVMEVLMDAVAEIHEKYPDFHMAHMP